MDERSDTLQNANAGPEGRDPKEAEISHLVQGLNSLEGGEQVAAKLASYGRAAIEPLKRFHKFHEEGQLEQLQRLRDDGDLCQLY